MVENMLITNSKNGIQIQHIVPYTPQKNNVAERQNHTLKEMANYVKGYRLIPLKSKNVIIRRNVKFAENISSYEPSLEDLPPPSIPSTYENISSSYDDSEDESPPPPSQDPPSTPQLPKWVYSTRDATEASGHLDWDATMNEEYCSLLANDTWDLVPPPKGRKLVRCKWVYRTNAKASPLLVGFTDSNWAGDPDDQNHTTSYVFTLGSGPITWAYKKKSVISLSSVEAKYHDVIEASKEVMWLRQIMSEFGFQQQHPTTLWCDNKSAIQLCKCPVQHQCSKHVELYMHFIRNLIHDNVLEVKYCVIDDQVSDIFTKALTEAKFTKLPFMVGV
eukprot:PITA_19108